MTTALGTTLGTVLGTDLGTFIDGPARFDASKTYALGSMSTANYYATAVGGGELGDATGFGAVTLLFVSSLPAADSVVLDSSGPGNTGFALQLRATGELRVVTFNGAGTLTAPAGYIVNASSLGKLLVATLQISGTLVQLRVSGVSPAVAAIAGYTPRAAGGVQALGRSVVSGQGFTVGALLASTTFRGTTTASQLTAVENAARTLGDIPSKAAIEALAPSATVTHRWSLRDTFATPNVPVSDGAAAPSSIPDSVTAATVDALSRVGAPSVTVIDPASYPRTTYGVMGFATTSYLETAQGAGIGSSAAGGAPFWLSISFNNYVAPAATVTILSNTTAASVATGFTVQMTTTGLVFYVNATSSAVIPNAMLTGRAVTVACQYTGSQLRVFIDGAQYGSDVVVTYAPPAATAKFTIGYFSANGTQSFPNGVVYLVQGGDTAPSSAALAAITTTTQPQAITGTQHRYDLTQDVAANGGPSAGVPATVQDRVGSDHLTRVGTGLVVSQRTERLWSYETTPILYGSTDHSASNYFEAPAGAAGNATAFGGTLVWRPRSGATSATRALVSTQATSPTRGFDIRTSGANASVSMIFLDAANTGRAAGSGTISATNLDKIHVFSFQWDGPNSRLRIYLNRAEIGTGVSITGHAVSPGKLQWGAQVGGANPAPFNDLYGFRMWDGVASLAQIQAQHDAILASDGRIQPLIGLTNTFEIDVTADCLANGGALPATLLERIGGNNLARIGSPSAAPQYARAFAF